MPSASFPGPLRKLAELPSPEKTCAVAGSTVGEGWADGVTEDEVRNAFSLIAPEWSAGDN